MLPEVSPEALAQVLNIESLPVVDVRTLISDSTTAFDVNKFVYSFLLSNHYTRRYFISSVCRRGILDIFLSTIAKNLNMQMKAKSNINGKALKTIYMSDYIQDDYLAAENWYFKGTICKELSMEVNTLLKDMSMVSIFRRFTNSVCQGLLVLKRGGGLFLELT